MLHSSSLYFSNIEVLRDHFDKYEGTLPDHIFNRLHQNQKWTPPTHIYVNCWQSDNHESEAMWRLYLSNNEGVAVRSTVGSLRSALPSGSAIRRVRYIEYGDEDLASDTTNVLYRDSYAAMTYKRRAFKHENEIRAMIISHENNSPVKKYDVCLATLVDAVVVAPDMPQWFHDIVADVTRKYCVQYGIDINVERSTLDLSPTPT